jgi:hypothetical protein
MRRLPRLRLRADDDFKIYPTAAPWAFVRSAVLDALCGLKRFMVRRASRAECESTRLKAT